MGSLDLGVLVPGGEGFCFAFDLGLVVDAGFPENLFFHESHQVMGHAVASQAEAVKVAGGGEGGGSADGFVFARTLAGRGLVMAGGSDEVTVAGVKIEVC